MKLKGSVKKLTPGAVIAAAAVSGALLIALRVYQSLTQIDPATGFFTDHTNPTVLLSYILAVAIAVIIPLISYLTPLSKAEYIAAAKRPLHALGCIALAAGIGAQVVTDFTSGERTRLVIASTVIGAVAFIALMMCFWAFLSGKEITKKARLLYVFPAAWGLCRTVSYFTIYTSYLKTSALLLAIFADMFLMVFLFEYAKKITGLGGDGNSPAYLSTALVCAVLQCAAAVTGIVGIVKGVEFIYTPFYYYRVAAALFCLTAVGMFLKNNVPDYNPEIEVHPLSAEAEETESEEPEEEETKAEAPEIEIAEAAEADVETEAAAAVTAEPEPDDAPADDLGADDEA